MAYCHSTEYRLVAWSVQHVHNVNKTNVLAVAEDGAGRTMVPQEGRDKGHFQIDKEPGARGPDIFIGGAGDM